YFAKLETTPVVFVVKKDIFETLNRDALALLPAQPWKLQADEIAEVRLEKEGKTYRLKRDGADWKIAEPFEAAANADLVKPLIDGLTKLSSERYEAQAAKQLANFGLDKPYLRVAVTPAATQDQGGKEKEDKDWTLTAPATAKADRVAIAELLHVWSGLKAERFADYGPKVDLAKYGLDKPTVSLTISVAKEASDPKPAAQTHTLLVGNPVGKESSERYARLDNQPGVFVVSAATAGNVTRKYLDYVDRTLLQFDAGNVTALER